jgi:hypothetical protein
MEKADYQDHTVDLFDRTRGGMEMRNDTTKTRVSTVRHVDPLVGNVSTYLIETVRAQDSGDFCFVEVATKDGNVRVVLPPKVTATIARQRDSLTTSVRRKMGREQAAERKAAGIEPFGGKRYTKTA